MNETRDYAHEISVLARWLLNNGYKPKDDNEGAVDCAIRIIQENTLDKVYTIFGKRFKHNDE
jgi:hypothetical protein